MLESNAGRTKRPVKFIGGRSQKIMSPRYTEKRKKVAFLILPDKEHVFSWLICESYDDKGNAIIYEYQAENSVGVDISQAHESNRDHGLSANRYLKCIRYGNCTPYQPDEDHSKQNWLFEVVFDYDEGHYETLPDENGCQFVRATRDKQRRMVSSTGSILQLSGRF